MTKFQMFHQTKDEYALYGSIEGNIAFDKPMKCKLIVNFFCFINTEKNPYKTGPERQNSQIIGDFTMSKNFKSKSNKYVCRYQLKFNP